MFDLKSRCRVLPKPVEIKRNDAWEVYDHRYAIDSWGLGAIIYRATFDRSPYRSFCTGKGYVDHSQLDLDVPCEYLGRRGWSVGALDGISDLLEGLLNRSPEKRMTSGQAVVHPWLQPEPWVYDIVKHRQLPWYWHFHAFIDVYSTLCFHVF